MAQDRRRRPRTLPTPTALLRPHREIDCMGEGDTAAATPSLLRPVMEGITGDD